MKKIMIVTLITISATIIFTNNYGKVKNSESTASYSFYKVPLVCSAAPSIGCGIKSKPVLQQFEKNSNVSEAWLNSAGTVIGVVWKDNVTSDERKNIMQSIFNEQNIQAEEVAGKEFEDLVKDFNLKKDWLRKNDVDKLSKIESEEIAQRLINRVNTNTTLNKETAEKLHIEIAGAIHKTFTTMDVSEINKRTESVMDNSKQTIVDNIFLKAKFLLNDSELKLFIEAISLGFSPVDGETGYSDEGCCSEMSKVSVNKCCTEGEVNCTDSK